MHRYFGQSPASHLLLHRFYEGHELHGCQTFMTSSATLTMCLSQFELVCCCVSLCQKRQRLFYGYADDRLALYTASNAPNLPCSFPKYTFQGFLMTCRAVCTLPSAAPIPLSQGMGLWVTWSEKVLFHIQCLLCFCLPRKP